MYLFVVAIQGILDTSMKYMTTYYLSSEGYDQTRQKSIACCSKSSVMAFNFEITKLETLRYKLLLVSNLLLIIIGQ